MYFDDFVGSDSDYDLFDVESEENVDFGFDLDPPNNHAVGDEARCRGPEEPVFEGGAYGLAAALWPRNPTVPEGYALPEWANRAEFYRQDETEFSRTWTAFIVHKESKAVVGWMSGDRVRNVRKLDKHSRQVPPVFALVYELFTDASSKGYFKLRPELKWNSIWGDAFDSGAFLAIEHIELVPAHRGKGALGHLGAAMRKVCQEWSTRGAIADVGFLDQQWLITDQTTTGPRNVSSLKKMRDSIASMGFRRVGITDWMAMVADSRHPCWKVSTHKAPEFPFRAFAKTVNNEAFRPLVEKCAKAESASRRRAGGGRRQDDWAEANVVREVGLAVDAFVAHDSEAFFARADGQQNDVLAELLFVVLRGQEALWRTDKSLGRGVRDLLDTLLAMGHPMPVSNAATPVQRLRTTVARSLYF